MKPSAQSLEALGSLLARRTLKSSDGSVVVGPLSRAACTLLRVLLREFDDLVGRSGEDQIEALRQEFVGEGEGREEENGLQVLSRPATESGRPKEEDHVERVRPEWRVVSLRCSSIRGVAPPEEDFEFCFGPESALLFGPNGSGKSSLLSVLCWVLRGQAPTDSPQAADQAPLYTIPSPGTRGSRFRDWPVVVTLPAGSECRTASPACWGELVLQERASRRELRLRRTFGAGLERKESGSEWQACEELGDIQVSPLDIQLSLVAPTVFGRQTLESAENTRDILSLMLGYDDLERLGELCSKMSGNRTRSANRLGEETDRLREQLRQDIGMQPERLPKGTPIETDLRALAAKTLPLTKEISDFGKKLSSAIAAAEKSLASVLGLETAEGEGLDGLADKLTVAVARLETDLWTLFPSLSALRTAVVFPDLPPEESECQRGKLEDRIVSFMSGVGPRIHNRFEWWKKETVPGSRATMLLRAAKHYDPEQETCPVCDRSVKGLPVAGQLASLREADPELAKELRTFFEDLRREMSVLLPADFLDLGRTPVDQRLAKDWQDLKKGSSLFLTEGG